MLVAWVFFGERVKFAKTAFSQPSCKLAKQVGSNRELTKEDLYFYFDVAFDSH